MKRNKFIIAVLVLVSSIGLSSCDDDDYWVRGIFNADYNIRTYPDGDFSLSYSFNRSHVEGLGGSSRYDIQEVRQLDAWIEITGDFRQGDVIYPLVIDVNGVGRYELPSPITIRNPNDAIIIDNIQYQDFMYLVARKLVFDGYLEMAVYGGSNIYNGDFRVAIRNSLDIRVRD